MSEAAKKDEREVQSVPPNRCCMAEHGRNIHLITAESGEYPLDFLDPVFYAHIARDMRPMDHVEIRTDDGTFWGEYLVLEAGTNYAKVHELRVAELKAVGEQPENKNFRVEWKGPHLKYAVIRKQDSAILHSGDQMRKDALIWLEEYERNIGTKKK